VQNIKIFDKAIWVPLRVTGAIYCPQCNSTLIIQPLTTFPDIAYCPACKKYFYDASREVAERSFEKIYAK
jgi:uncharacterized Zn finger protein (UPF0148 family)